MKREHLNDGDAEDLALAAFDAARSTDTFVRLSAHHPEGTLDAYAVGTTDPDSARQLQAFVNHLPDTRSLAQVGYESYAAHTLGKTFDGRDMPTWDALPLNIQAAWETAALGISAALLRRPADE